MNQHTHISASSPEIVVTHGDTQQRVPLGAIMHMARYDRMCRANTIHWSLTRVASAVSPPYNTGTAHVLDFDTEEVSGDLYDEVSHTFAPQTIGRYDVDVMFSMRISNALADALSITLVQLLFIEIDEEGNETTTLLGFEVADRWYDPGTALNYSTKLKGWTINAPFTVDHTPGKSYRVEWTHDGAGDIDFVGVFTAHCSFHYYDTKTEAYPDGGE